jgi:hypothetical protein
MKRLVASLAAGLVGVGVVARGEGGPTNREKVDAAQNQILYTARYYAAHPPQPDDLGDSEIYSAAINAQDAEAIGQARQLTAQRVGRFSFSRAFDEASDVGGMVIDVSDMTSLPVETVLSETLPKSTITALNKRNIHFIYNSPERNPFVQEGDPQIGYIPLSTAAAAPEHVTATPNYIIMTKAT